MKIICFYWHGERWQETLEQVDDISFKNHLRRVGTVSRELASRYVNNLYQGVRKWASKDFDFICFTNESLDVHENIEIRPIDLITKRGVLPRMYMFSEQAGLFGHQVLCLDLDVVITGKLTDIMDYKGLFCTRRSFNERDENGNFKLDGDTMSFYAGKETEAIFWKPLIQDIQAAEKETQGRERLWVRKVAHLIADTFDEMTPGQIISYKMHAMRNGLPKNARIVSFHGHPRPHQVHEQWVKHNWQ